MSTPLSESKISTDAEAATAAETTAPPVPLNKPPLHKRLVATVEALLPDKLKKLMDAWGVSVLVGFSIGFSSASITVVSLYLSGSMPSVLVSKEYTKPFTDINADKTTSRVKPKLIGLERIKAPTPEWLQPYIKYYEHEAKSKKESNPNLRVGIAVIESEELPPTTEFTWVLNAASGYSISVFVFRKTKEGLIQPLINKPEKEAIKVLVPGCESGDKLIAVIKAEWVHNVPLQNISTTFFSSID